jgi:hypothetical protein
MVQCVLKVHGIYAIQDGQEMGQTYRDAEDAGHSDAMVEYITERQKV